MRALTEDALLDGRVRLIQPARGHRAGTDAVLLAAAVPLEPGDRVVDAGAATGAVGLMLACRASIRVVLVERDPGLADLCRRNLALNGRAGQVAAADLIDRSTWPAELEPGSADLVATNPPFLETRHGRASPDPARAAAHVLPEGGLAQWLEACAALLKPGGRLVLVQRADRLADCLGGLGRGFGAMRLRFVHGRADAPAARLILTATKGSRAPLAIDPPLVLHDGEGRFTPLAERIHRGDALLQ